MIKVRIQLISERRSRKTGDFHPERVEYDRESAYDYNGPEDIDFIKSSATNDFNEFKNLLPGILKGLV